MNEVTQTLFIPDTSHVGRGCVLARSKGPATLLRMTPAEHRFLRNESRRRKVPITQLLRDAVRAQYVGGDEAKT